MKIKFTDSALLIRSLFRRITPFSSETAILFGIYAVGIIFLLLFFFDVYLFYASVIRETQKAPLPPSPVFVSREDITKVVGILDKREQEFKKILAQ